MNRPATHRPSRTYPGHWEARAAITTALEGETP